MKTKVAIVVENLKTKEILLDIDTMIVKDRTDSAELLEKANYYYHLCPDLIVLYVFYIDTCKIDYRF